MRSHSPNDVYSTNKQFIERIPWKKFGSFTLFLPLAGLAFCVIYSIAHNFNEANATHCNVWNFLPSISAAAGSVEPQMSVWWWCIVLHTLPRYFICICYLIVYTSLTSDRFKKYNQPWAIACAILNGTEVSALLLLTLVSSSSDFGVHKTSFLMFIITSILYMIFTIIIQKSLYMDSMVRQVNVSLRYKKIFFCANVLSLLMAGYTYWRHNTYCEPIVYSMFALSEYLVVLTNIAFHSTAIIDFTSALPVSTKSMVGTSAAPYLDV